MNKFIFAILALVAILVIPSDQLWGRGGMGGGGRGGGGGRAGGGARPSGGAMRTGGGGGARPSFSGGSMPSMSRPSQSFSRPSGGNIAGNRPSMGNLPKPTNRPATNINRPSGNIANNRPNINNNRPGLNGRPTQNQLHDFLNIPGGGAAMAGAAGGALAGGAAAEFLHDRPSGQFPGGGNAARPGQNRPSPGDLAGGDNRPNRPGEGGGGEQFRPGGDNRPDRPGGDNRPNRPGEGGGGEQFRPGGDNRPNRPGGDNRPDRPGGDNRPDRPGTRPGSDWWSQNHPGIKNNWNQWNNFRHDHWTNINNDWHNHWSNNWNNCNHWFNNNWWHDHPCDGWRWPNNVNWWAVAGWGAVTNWMPWGWSEPIYYNYGQNVVYDGDQVYYGDQPIATADEYADQAEAIATSIPQGVQPAPDDWMPLGVFAVTQDGDSTGGDPTMFLQLAVSKQGIIAGTFQNTATGTVKSVEGMVDKETQRAAWTAIGESRPLMETGISNLTQDTAGVLVHFANGDTQQWLLVRLDQPTAAKTQ